MWNAAVILLLEIECWCHFKLLMDKSMEVIRRYNKNKSEKNGT